MWHSYRFDSPWLHGSKWGEQYDWQHDRQWLSEHQGTEHFIAVGDPMSDDWVLWIHVGEITCMIHWKAVVFQWVS